MKKLIQYIGAYKKAVGLILVLLMIQAFCDLSLPTRTSDIVDVGIQNQGIKNAVPEQMRIETYESLMLFLNESEAKTVASLYKVDDEKAVLQAIDKEQEEELDRILGEAIMVLSYAQESGEFDYEQMNAMLEQGVITREQILEQREDAMDKIEANSTLITRQMAIPFIQNEYEEMGLDMGDIQMDYLIKEGLIMLGYTLLAMIASVLAGMIASHTAARLGMNLRGNVFKKVLSFSNGEMDQFSTASLITRSTNDVQQIQTVSVFLLRLIMYAPILGIGGVIKVLNTRTGMGWIIAVGVGVVLLLVTILMQVAMPKFKKMQVLIDHLNLVSREILTGLSVIRAFSREKHEEERFAKANKDLMSTQLFTSRAMTFMMPLMMLIMNGMSILIVWVGGHGVDSGNLQVGDMMAFITYSMQIVMSFLMLSMVSVMLPRAGVSADRIDEILQTQPTIMDPDEFQDEQIRGGTGKIAFEHVSFRYPNADEDALEDISFTATPGKVTAIIGSTGSGKSTLVHLIPRFYDVTKGRITMDGVDVRELSLHKLRSFLGFVPQKGVLFSGDIASNIKFGEEKSTGEKITDGDMIRAAEIAQATEFIDEKEEQYQSSISQGGSNVSGGQKQRLSIARAIARRPKVFLFDDSFSALDYRTDSMLRSALKDKMKDAVVIIVAQRISTILHAEQIIVLDDGKVAGIGTHKELLESCEAYQEIAKSQLSEAELKGGQGA